MKVNLQKVTAISLSFFISLSFLNIPVFADTASNPMTVKDFYVSQSYITDSWVNGNITYDEWLEQQNSLTDEFFITNRTADDEIPAFVHTVGDRFRGFSQKFANAVKQWGDEAKDRLKELWDSACKKSNVPSEQIQTSTTDREGYGAMAVRYVYGLVRQKFFCSYIYVTEDKSHFYMYNNDGSHILTYHYRSGDYAYSNTSMAGSSTLNYNEPDDYVLFYGDIRYDDDTPFPTDDEYKTTTIYHFDETPVRNLEDLFNYLSEQLNNSNPDLSSLEGLLQSIYYRLGTLDQDDDNVLLSHILASLKFLENKKEDFSELTELLTDIKDSLVFGDDENKENFAEQLKEFIDNQITFDDFVIDEDLYNNHVEILKERLLGKFSFIYNIKTFVEYCFNEYSNTSEIPELEILYNGKSYSINFNFFNDYLPTIQFILAAFIYLTYAYHTYRKIPSYINGGDNE